MTGERDIPGKCRSSGEHDHPGSSLENGNDGFRSLRGCIFEIMRFVRDDDFELTVQEFFVKLREEIWG